MDEEPLGVALQHLKSARYYRIIFYCPIMRADIGFESRNLNTEPYQHSLPPSRYRVPPPSSEGGKERKYRFVNPVTSTPNFINILSLRHAIACHLPPQREARRADIGSESRRLDTEPYQHSLPPSRYRVPPPSSEGGKARKYRF